MRYIILHHTGGTEANSQADTSNHTFEIVDQYHREKFNMQSALGHWLGYHYFIDKQGRITQARKDTEEGAHTKGYNHEIGIGLAGNFDVTLPTIAQTESLKALLTRLIVTHGTLEIVPHRKFSNKTCFGSKLSDNWAKNLVYNETVLEMVVQALKALLELLRK